MLIPIKTFGQNTVSKSTLLALCQLADRILVKRFDRNKHFTRSFFQKMRQLKLYNPGITVFKISCYKHIFLSLYVNLS